MVDVRRLRLLHELSRRGTIAATAQALGFTPSAVSQQLGVLEREAGVPLLERDGRRVVLTPAARALVVRTGRILDELAAAAADLDAAATTVAGEVRVGAFPSAALRLVVPAVRELRARHPHVEVALWEIDPAEGLQLLHAGTLDVLVDYAYDLTTPLPDGGLRFLPLLTDPVLVAVPDAHPHTGPVELAALASERWVAGLPGTPFGTLVQRACRAAGFEPDIVHRSREFGVQQALVAAGMGVALLPALGRTGDGPDVRFLPLRSPAIARRVRATARRGALRRPTVAAVVRALRTAALKAL